MRTRAGRPNPLGASWTGAGTQFALYSAAATRVELCLFDSPQASEPSRARRSARAHPERLARAAAGASAPGSSTAIASTVPTRPEHGQRFNPHKLLVDPYARAIAGDVRWSDALRGRSRRRSRARTRARPARQRRRACRSRSSSIRASIGGRTVRRARRGVARSSTSAHVKGMTARHPGIPPALRGTFLGLASEPVIEHLLALGVTAVELLPVHHRVSEERARAARSRQLLGLQHARLLRPGRALRDGRPRRAGARVQGDGEGAASRGNRGAARRRLQPHRRGRPRRGRRSRFAGSTTPPTTSLRPDRPSEYLDFTGCGNALNLPHPRVLQLVLDSLRYWVSEMHVDGFRFDLAPALARGFEADDGIGRFFALVQQDPVLARSEADRRAVGPGREWLPARRLPRRLGRVERQVPRLRAPLLARRRRPHRASWRRGSRAATTSSAGEARSASVNFVTATTASRCATS